MILKKKDLLDIQSLSLKNENMDAYIATIYNGDLSENLATMFFKVVGVNLSKKNKRTFTETDIGVTHTDDIEALVDQAKITF